MPKIKTCKSVAKRFKVTGSGRIKRSQAYRNHIMNKKSPKRKRNLRKTGYVHETQEKAIHALMPYK